MMSKSLPDINHFAFKEARENSKLSQEQLANQLCLSAKHIHQLENQSLTVFFSLSHKVQVAKKVARHLGIPLDVALIEKKPTSSALSEPYPSNLPVESSTIDYEKLNYHITSQKVNELTEISLEIPAQYSPPQTINNSSRKLMLSVLAAFIGLVAISVHLLFDLAYYFQPAKKLESEISYDQPTVNHPQTDASNTNNSVMQPANSPSVKPATNHPTGESHKPSQGNQ